MEQVSTEYIVVNHKEGEKFFSWAGRLPGIPVFLTVLVAAFYIPVTLIWSGIIPFQYRFHLSAMFIVFVLVFCAMRQHGLRDLGFRYDNLGGSLFWNGIFCLIGGVVLFLLYKAGYQKSPYRTVSQHCYLAYIFLLAPAQEFFFRGVLFAEIKKTMLNASRWALLLITSVSFCFLHVIYGHLPMVIITFCAAILWGIIYDRHPNIWGVSISHSLLGIIAIAFGII